MIDITFRDDLINTFMNHVERPDDTECWIWDAWHGSHGYGQFNIHKPRHVVVLAHRAAFMLFKGPIDHGKMILHSCHNRRCVNPEHLREGDGRDNAADTLTAGRAYSKITPDQVREIRANYKSGDVGFGQLAKAYGVSVNCIRRIIRHESWKSIK